MKLKDRFKDLKRDYKDFIVLIVSGSFYVSYDSDAVLLSYLFSYQIKNDRVGFPSSALDKIVNSLCEKHIRVVVVGSEICESVFDDNLYYVYLDEAFKFFNNHTMLDSLIDRIRLLVMKDFDNYIKIKGFIDEL